MLFLRFLCILAQWQSKSKYGLNYPDNGIIYNITCVFPHCLSFLLAYTCGSIYRYNCHFKLNIEEVMLLCVAKGQTKKVQNITHSQCVLRCFVIYGTHNRNRADSIHRFMVK